MKREFKSYPYFLIGFFVALILSTLMMGIGHAQSAFITAGGGGGKAAIGAVNMGLNAAGVAVPVTTNVSTTPNLRVDTEPSIPSYISSFTVTPSTIGVFAQICGPSVGNATRVRGFDIQGDASTAGLVTLVANKTSSASAGGTAVTPTPMDANDVADTASLKYFSTPPTAGTSVGPVYQAFYYMPLPAAVANPLAKSFGAQPYDMKSIVLRSASQCLQLSTSGTLPAGASFIINIYDTAE